MLERIAARFARFVEPPTDEAALASTLLGALQAFTTPTDRGGPGAAPAALHQQPEDGKLRNLVAMAELRQCCADADAGPALKQVPQMLLAGLAVEPNNGDLLANLQTTYAWLAGQPAGARARRGSWRPAWCGSMPTCAPDQAGMPLRSGWRRVAAESGSPVPMQRPLAARRPRRGAGRVRRGASRSWSRAFRAAMRQGYRDHTLRGAPFWSTGAGPVSRARPFKRLRRHSGSASRRTPRLAAAGLSAAEVGARLAEIEDLRHALGELLQTSRPLP